MASEKWLIDANELISKVNESKHNNPHPQGMVRVNHRNEHDHFLKLIYDAPIVDAAPVAHGRWTAICNGYKWMLNCNLCNCYMEVETSKNYCPNCGAKMDEKES